MSAQLRAIYPAYRGSMLDPPRLAAIVAAAGRPLADSPRIAAVGIAASGITRAYSLCG